MADKGSSPDELASPYSAKRPCIMTPCLKFLLDLERQQLFRYDNGRTIPKSVKTNECALRTHNSKVDETNIGRMYIPNWCQD
mmetsp:Transcript_2645/g.3679  ORF Transcript_2645/g.3679 Transcript_2645/m.3679 type:complete len:82 (+) Transcript_2645:522-767(+)|eukprot:CAMPEP_0116065698 /NCGR_PEP_ID=MMETSP0322-20121206/9930_1 /TAXON_ID=163516 /ORGANISM="Leptocylindrus danicus var. apora, Strain B651" /LENGTH=81 /DNA_ID=CAMNT_0003552087 /DNA_START=438 /DNA_END=683 /DNA_ORIENTATION=-